MRTWVVAILTCLVIAAGWLTADVPLETETNEWFESTNVDYQYDRSLH